MKFETASRMQVVRKQEKEPRIKDFIRTELSSIPIADATTIAVDCVVVARTIDSPVMRALAAHSAEFKERAITVRTILSSLDVPAEGPGPGAADWLSTCQSRWTRNTRLADAHEFLVLGDRATWIGDCMRRDPQKRDAFEGFNPESPATAELARRSFERLWQLSVPVSRKHRWVPLPAAQPEPTTTAPGAAAVAAALEVPTSPTPGATRH